MDIHSPKRTIIINTFNSKVLCPLPTNTIPVVSHDRLLKPEEMSKKSRKRSLDYLSYEEKLMRKKLKNREAAQTSRDRKKAHMDELEKTVRLLQKSNNELTKEVKLLRSEKDDIVKLRCQIETLKKENEQLREELRCACEQSTLESKGSAVSVLPLPQGHSSAPTLLLTFLLIQMISFQRIAYLGWTISNLSMTSSMIGSQASRTRKNVIKYLTKLWHPHQPSWNPMNLHYPHLVAVT